MGNNLKKFSFNHRGFKYNNLENISKEKNIRHYKGPQRLNLQVRITWGDLLNFELSIDNMEAMTHIILNLPEASKSIVKNLKENHYGNYYPMTIESICENLLTEMKNLKGRQKSSVQNTQYKGAFTTFRKYVHRYKYCWHK